MSWEEKNAEALEAKADTIEQAVVTVERIVGIYSDSSKRRHEVLSFVQVLQTDADNYREEAKRIREAGPSLKPIGRG